MPVDDDLDFYKATDAHLYIKGVEVELKRIGENDSFVWVDPVEKLNAKRKRQRERWSKVRPTNDWRKRK